MKRIIQFLLICVTFSISLSCDKKHSYVELVKSINNQVTDIPYDTLVCIRCSQFPFEYKKRTLAKIVHIIDQYGCTGCAVSLLAKNEKLHCDLFENGAINSIYIVSVPTESREATIRLLKQYRLRSEVYLDTCNAFLSANPQIPDNELFHTFVINNEGKVLMVGNPFQNEKMEALFKKVIANEQKKHKG